MSARYSARSSARSCDATSAANGSARQETTDNRQQRNYLLPIPRPNRHLANARFADDLGLVAMP